MASWCSCPLGRSLKRGRHGERWSSPCWNGATRRVQTRAAAVASRSTIYIGRALLGPVRRSSRATSALGYCRSTGSHRRAQRLPATLPPNVHCRKAGTGTEHATAKMCDLDRRRESRNFLDRHYSWSARRARLTPFPARVRHGGAAAQIPPVMPRMARPPDVTPWPTVLVVVERVAVDDRRRPRTGSTILEDARTDETALLAPICIPRGIAHGMPPAGNRAPRFPRRANIDHQIVRAPAIPFAATNNSSPTQRGAYDHPTDTGALSLAWRLLRCLPRPLIDHGRTSVSRRNATLAQVCPQPHTEGHG